MSTMPIAWRSSAETLAGTLRRHGVDANGVADVEAAWQGFSEFLQIEIGGLDPEPDSDADGFIVQWGRYSWNERRPSLTFTRQLAVVSDERNEHDPRSQAKLWQIDLEMRFHDEPELVGIEALPRQDTGFSFAPIGLHRQAALAEMRLIAAQYLQVEAAWRAAPVTSELTLNQAC
jgi:hypothetical protein